MPSRKIFSARLAGRGCSHSHREPRTCTIPRLCPPLTGGEPSRVDSHPSQHSSLGDDEIREPRTEGMVVLVTI